MKVSAQYAEEHFADILGTAIRGEDVEIATPEQASVRMTLVKQASKVTARRPRHELLGAWEGLVKAPTEEEWRAIKRDLAANMPDFSPRTDESA